MPAVEGLKVELAQEKMWVGPLKPKEFHGLHGGGFDIGLAGLGLISWALRECPNFVIYPQHMIYPYPQQLG